MKAKVLGMLALGMLGASLTSQAAIVQLDFEGVGDFAAINDFYNGGTDSLGNSGTNYGVSFSSQTLGLIDEDAGGGGNFANEPSPSTIMFFLDSNDAILNVAAGFTTGFSFFYSSSTAASVDVYDGLDGTGTLLTSLLLTAQGFDNCVGDPNGAFCNWTAVGVLFSGTAKSIDFGGTANQSGFDNITFGTDNPDNPNDVPEPGTLALLGLGLAGLGLSRRRKTN
jgi:hypothetical protein